MNSIKLHTIIVLLVALTPCSVVLVFHVTGDVDMGFQVVGLALIIAVVALGMGVYVWYVLDLVGKWLWNFVKRWRRLQLS
jgi:hypothetical protein